MPDTLPIESKVNKEVLAALGLAIITWSAIEHALAYHIVRMLAADGMTSGARRSAQLIVNGMDARTSLGILKSLGRFQFEESDLETLDKIVDGLTAAYTNRRNILAHHVYAAGDKPDRMRASYAKTVGKINITKTTLTTKEIRSWALDFHRRAVELDKFFSDRL